MSSTSLVGRLVYVLRWVQNAGEDGEPTGITGVYLDLTNAEAQRRRRVDIAIQDQAIVAGENDDDGELTWEIDYVIDTMRIE